MKESNFQTRLIKKLKKIFPDAIILKNDPTYIQGIPDIIILQGSKWAALECKRSKGATHRPNQDYYVGKMRSMGFSDFIYPENEEDVLNNLHDYFL